MSNVSLVNGPFLAFLAALSFAAVIAALGGSPRHWDPRFVIVAALALSATVFTALFTGVEHRVGSSFPRSFLVWAALPLFAMGVGALSWKTAQPLRRLMAAASVVLLFAFGAAQVNAHYAYLPTVGDVLGRPLPGQLPKNRPVPLTVPSMGTGSPGQGAVVITDVPAPTSHFRARPAYIWLPPAYFRSPTPTLPVVLLLGGVPGSPIDMLRSGHGQAVAERYAKAHDGVAPILVSPDLNGGFWQDTECVDGPRGNAERYLSVDVPRYVIDHFSTAVDPGSWGIFGYSEGGTCAITLGLRHPERFGAYVDVSGGVRPTAALGSPARQRRLTTARLFGGSVARFRSHDPEYLLTQRRSRTTTGRLFAGSRDRDARRSATRLMDASGSSHQLSLQVLPAGTPTRSCLASWPSNCHVSQIFSSRAPRGRTHPRWPWVPEGRMSFRPSRSPVGRASDVTE
ncbi:MAG: hypothetical protein QOJ29_318 [Thermoleophilaceae bacterium]|nr:hypothetical protein [Thermoleophilaceae bacterium]